MSYPIKADVSDCCSARLFFVNGGLRCEKCGGNGKVGQRLKDSIEYNIIPCPECSGSGIGYCCEGERAEVTALLAERTIKTTETKDP